MAYATARKTRFQDPDDARPVSSDLLSRKPHDVEPRPATCGFCGAPTLRAWASDPNGPAGSRMTDFDPEPAEAGRWFMGADGSLTFDPKHGTHQLHDCTRPAGQPATDTFTEAVA